MTTATTIDTVKFVRKANGSYEGIMSLVQVNLFTFRAQLQRVKREGYTLVPAQYEKQPCTGLVNPEAVWLYRAHRGNRTLWIHANPSHKLP